jgi:Mn-dependent DtxR family transcriptional regulator
MAIENRTREMCRRLRSKGMYVEVEPEDGVRQSTDGFYWCSQTLRCLGPDGKVVTKEACQLGRACFESSVRS